MIEKIEVDGTTYDVEDFEGRELVDAERAFGISLMLELERASMQGVYALLYLIKKRENRAFTVDDALNLKLGDVSKMLGGDEEDEVPPPNRAARRAKKPASTGGTGGTRAS